MYAGLVVCYWAVTLAILFALDPAPPTPPRDLEHKVGET